MPHRLRSLLLEFGDLFTMLISLYNANIPAKLLVISLTSSVLVPAFQFVNRYIYSDWSFFGSFMILLTVDVITGIVKASGKYDLSGKTPNSLDKRIFIIKLTEKLFVAVVWLYLTHFAVTYLDQVGTFTQLYTNYFGKSVVITWIFWSISTNLFVITDGQFPPIGFIKSLQKLKDSGNTGTENVNAEQERKDELEELSKKK